MITVKAWRLKMKPGWVCMPEIADLHHYDEEQVQVPDLDLDPY
jgi:hypothetical protein